MHFRTSRLTIMTAALFAPIMAWPGATQAGDGQIVVVRQVPPRNAFVKGDPAHPVAVNPSPAGAVNSALGLDRTRGGTVRRELTDADIAGVSSGTPMHTTRATSAANEITLQAVASGSGDPGGPGYAVRGIMSGGGFAGSAGATAGGAVQRGTQQLNGIMSGLPQITR